MFDVGASELLVIGAVALLVIGPKELPGLIRTMGEMTSKVRRMAAEFRGQFDDAMREAELDQAKKAFTDAADTANSVRSSFNPLDTIRNELASAKDTITRGTAVATGAAVGAATVATAASADSPNAPQVELPPPPEPAPLDLSGFAPPPAAADVAPAAASPVKAKDGAA
jgi:sec-independent protein translocase protein TatB